MASYTDSLEDDNKNWIKGALALRITKAGLQSLVERDSRRIQQKIHYKVLQASNLLAGTTCGQCLTENLLPCPTTGLCSHPRNCKYHNSPLKMYRPNCPSHICDAFRDEICAVHRFSRPSWKNTKADRWNVNYWEVSKCFMPPDGYDDVTSYAETDFNGIINVMINCTEFQHSMSFTIGNQPNALTKAREIGRNIRHSPDLKVTDTDLKDYFATLSTLLKDSTFLASDKYAQQSVLKLKQLEQDALQITTEDLRKLKEETRWIIELGKREIAESAKTGKQEIEDVLSQGKTVFEKGKHEIVASAETGKREIEGVVSQSKTIIEKGKHEIVASAETGKQEIEGVVSQGKTIIEKGKHEIAETAETGKQKIEGVVSHGKTVIETGKHELAMSTETGKQEIETVVLQGKTVIETGQRVIVESAETGKQEIEDVVLQGKTVFEIGKHEIAESAKTGKEEIEGVVLQGKTIIETGKLEVAESAKTGKQEIEGALSQGKIVIETGKRELATSVDMGKQELEGVVFLGKTELEEALQKANDVSEAEQIEELRGRLVKYYQKQLNTAPISALLSDKDERLDKLYVPPKIMKKNHKTTKEGLPGLQITSYKNIFCEHKGLTNTVFVVGEAGMGKTSFSAMCTMKWASQFSVSISDIGENGSDQGLKDSISFHWPAENDSLSTSFREKGRLKNDRFQDEDIFKNIEFIFYLKLRNCCESCELSDMIQDQLINIIYQPDERADGYSTMLRVLSNRNCVIIADGLDEWSHPIETKCLCSVEDKAIPYLSSTLDATVLITSRPWRVSRMRVKDTRIDTYLEIQGVDNKVLLVYKALVCLNERDEENKSYRDFFRFVSNRKLRHLLAVPIIALLLVCIWFEGRHESFSLCGIYAYMMDMILGRKALPQLSVTLESNTLLRCFEETEHVQKYYNIVLRLAQFAFEKLFSKDRKSSLVFQKVDCLTSEELLFILKSGFIRETKSQSLIRKSSSFSFIHKNVQVFLAAVHIAHHTEEIQRVIKPKYHEAVKELLDLDDPWMYWSMTMHDVSQICIFMCGLNSEAALEMSAVLSHGILQQDRKNDYESVRNLDLEVQRTICCGYKEAKTNNVKNIHLALYSFRFRYNEDRDVTTLKALMSMNKSQIHHIQIEGHQDIISAKELQEVFTMSASTLIDVSIRDRDGSHDLSACRRLKYLLITKSKTSNIKINTENLVSLELSDISPRVESSILQSLGQGCKYLQRFETHGITNISLFCQTLPQLNHLGVLIITMTNLNDHDLLIPPSVISVILYRVTMTARSLKNLAERVNTCPNTRKCFFYNCRVLIKVRNVEATVQYIKSRIRKLDIRKGNCIVGSMFDNTTRLANRWICL